MVKKKREGDDENTNFSPAWEIKFALAEIHERPACLIRQKTIAVSKQTNLQRYHKQLYTASKVAMPLTAIRITISEFKNEDDIIRQILG